MPLCKPGVLKGKLAERLNPVFEVDGRKMAMLTPEIAGVPRNILAGRVANLSGERRPIIAALDLLITGI